MAATQDRTEHAAPASPSGTPQVTVVTPAWRAAQTLAATCASLRASLAARGEPDWEHVIATRADDTATDRLAAGLAAADPRVRHVRTEGLTAGAARNTALAHARGDFVLFLDADDTVGRWHLSTLLEAAAQAGADIVVTGHRMVSARGIELRRDEHAPGPVNAGDLRDGPIAALHAMLFRRDLLDRIGGFDGWLETNEDWDLCLRAAAAGARFHAIPGARAHYRVVAGSLTCRGPLMLADRADVLGRALKQMPVDDVEAAIGRDALRTALWCGARAVAMGQEPADLLAALAAAAPLPPQALDRDEVAAALLDGLLLGFAARHAEIEGRMAGRWRALAVFLSEVARIAEDPGFDAMALRALEADLARIGPARRRRIGRTLVVPPLRAPLALGDEVAQVVVRVPLLRPRGIATHVFAPQVAAGRAPADLVTRRLAEEAAGHPLGGEGRAATLRDTALRAVTVARRRLLSRQPEAAEEPAGPQEGNDWEGIFASEDPWHYHRPYEQRKYERTLALLPQRRFARALELACAEGLFTVRLAPRVEALTAADISPTAVERASARCAEAGVGNVSFEVVDFFNEDFGQGWDLIVSSEVLYYMGSPAAVSDYARRVAAALADDGLFLHAHAYEVSDDPQRTGFDWGDDFAASTISAAFSAEEGLVHEAAVESELYRIELYRKRAVAEAPPPRVPAAPAFVSVKEELDPELAADVVWNGALRTRIDAEAERTSRLPVLLYHSIAEDGPAGLAPWRVTPHDFEHQLRFLRRRGYRPVTLAEWEQARDRSAAMSGRPVLITFDDGFADFAEMAWPILRRNGFGAQMFVVSGAVGGTADWDAWYGAPRPLMDWDCLSELAEQGLEVGAHLHRHRPLDRLDPATVLDEARRSREDIATRLGTAPRAVAPPYGICGPEHGDLLAAAGFERVFLAGGGVAPVWGPRLATPRIEVPGAATIAEFAELVGAKEPPEAADLP